MDFGVSQEIYGYACTEDANMCDFCIEFDCGCWALLFSLTIFSYHHNFGQILQCEYSHFAFSSDLCHSARDQSVIIVLCGVRR